MAKRTWRRGEPYHFIPVGDVAKASEWLPYAQTRVEMMMSGMAPVLTELAPYLRQVFHPTPDVKITIESLYGIPRITIETGGYDYITVGDTFSAWNSLRGLYAGKFGLGKKAKRIDPYTFDPHGIGFALGPDGNIGESLLYAGGNTFISGPLPFPPSPAYYATVAVNGTTPTLKLLSTGDVAILNVFYGGKSPEGGRRYEAHGISNVIVQLPEGFSSSGGNQFQAVTSIDAPTYTSTVNIDSNISVTGASGVVDTAIASVPSLFTVIRTSAPSQTPGAPNFPAKNFVLIAPTGLPGGPEANYVYVRDEFVTPPGAVVGLYKLTTASIDGTVANIRNNRVYPHPFAAAEPTLNITASTYTSTLGDETTTTVKFSFDFTYKVWAYDVMVDSGMYEDLLYAIYSTFSGPVVQYHSGGESIITYTPEPDYHWIKFANVADGSATRLSNGRIAILTTTQGGPSYIKYRDFISVVDLKALYDGSSNDQSVYSDLGPIDSINDFFDTIITIVSNDNGLTWNAKVTPGEIGIFGPIVYIGGDSILGFGDIVGSQLYGVWRSDDGGVSYSQVSSTLAELPASFPVCFAPGVVGFYVFRQHPSLGYGRFYRTIDSGATWTSYDIPLEILTKTGNRFEGRIAILKVGETYATTRLAILVRLDAEVIDGVNTQQSQIIISDDGGETWRLDTKVFPQVFGTDIGALNTGLPPNPGLPDTDQP